MTTLNSSESTDPKTTDTPTPEDVQPPSPEEAVAPESEAGEAAAETAPESELPEATVDEDSAAGEVPATGPSSSGFLSGTGAVVGAGLGLASVTGTSLTDMLLARKEIIGQIDAVTGGGGDQVQALYGAPWEAAAVVNGVFALIAVLIGGGVFALTARQAGTSSWIKAVALGGAVLGVIGLLVAGGMYFDLFGSQPTVPAQPMMPPG